MVCQEEDILTEEKVDILENVILPEAAKMHSERLLVRPLDGPLVVPRFREGSVCGKFPVPEEDHTDGVPDADMVLYATAVPTFKPTFAWAMPCATLGPRGRPVVGVINYNPRHIENTSQHIRVAVHEMAHALGFIVADMEEQALVKREVGVRGRSSVRVVNSRNTLEQARRHYGCESAPGMELEFVPPMRNPAAPGGRGRGARPGERRERGGGRSFPDLPGGRGGRGAGRLPAEPMRRRARERILRLRAAQHISASTQAAADGTLSTGTTLTVVEKQWRPPSWLGLMSHWGRRNAKDELMASFVVSGYYTAITMALFTDLGYYKANFEMAEPMSWGSGAGCALLTDKCVTDGATLYPDMFCTDSSDATLRCTSDRQSLGTCAIYQDDNIPPEFQYFATKQGSRRGAMMEYCPFIAPMNGTGCMDGDEAIMPGSVVGPSSRCLTGENLRMGSTVVGDVCVQLRCGEGTLSVRYRGSEEWHPCAPGQTLTPPAPFTAGSIRCPLFSDVCLTMLKHSDASSALAVTSAPLLLLLIVIGTVIVAP
ncbi:putative surface protease GP63 [Trypanosoma cruzi]|uniref:Leishmanolysin-like peptidase n=1 Tax=Trypanosoma cruzi TaxID=5693 RepID=A0A2V2WW07_TRYCR|nr:putative surface protease GP63 [Trypanosoma cruzi]